MKYLDDFRLQQMTAQLSEAVVGGRVLQGRVEAYTTKRTARDKKYATTLGERFVAELQAKEERAAALASSMMMASASSSATKKRTDDGNNKKKRGRGRSQSLGLLEEATTARTNKSNKQARFAVADAGGGATAPDVRRGRNRAQSFDVASSSSSYATTVVEERRRQASSSSSLVGDLRAMQTRRLLTDLILTLNASFPDYDFGNTAASSSLADFEAVTVQQAVRHVQERLSEYGNHHHQNNNNNGGKTNQSIWSNLWTSIHSVVPLDGCEVYSYTSPLPLSEQPHQVEYDDYTSSAPPMTTRSTIPATSATRTTNRNSYKQRQQHHDHRSFLRQTTTPSTTTNNHPPPPPTVLWSFNYFFVNRTVKRIVFFTCTETVRPPPPRASSSLYDDDEEEVDASGVGDDLYFLPGNTTPSRHRHAATGVTTAAGAVIPEDDDDDDEEVVEEDDDEDAGYSMLVEDHDGDAQEPHDVDLDPAAARAGGIPITIA